MYKAQLEEDLMMEGLGIWRRAEAEMLATPNLYLRRLLETRRALEPEGSRGHPLRRTVAAMTEGSREQR
jgi:hypothetical protein